MTTATRSTARKNNGVKAVVDVEQVSNHGEFVIECSKPYIATVRIEGVASLLFHAWNCEAVDAQSKAVKGSAAKKTDNLESFVYRCADGTLGIPASYMRGAICNANGAAKYLQDPRSPRKSALDLYRAGVVVLTEIASLGVKDWDYLDKRREVIQRSAITRTRPTMLAGWTCEFDIQVILPEYIEPRTLHKVLIDAGRLCGFGDHRPTHGRFQITSFKVAE